MLVIVSFVIIVVFVITMVVATAKPFAIFASFGSSRRKPWTGFTATAQDYW